MDVDKAKQKRKAEEDMPKWAEGTFAELLGAMQSIQAGFNEQKKETCELKGKVESLEAKVQSDKQYIDKRPSDIEGQV